MDGRLSKCRHVRTYTHLYARQRSIYCCRVRLCLETNRKIVCQPSYGTSLTFARFRLPASRHGTSPNEETDPPSLSCVFLLPLCSFICPFISFRRSVDVAERDGSREELELRDLLVVTFRTVFPSSPCHHHKSSKCSAANYAPTNFLDMDYARGFPELNEKKLKEKFSSIINFRLKPPAAEFETKFVGPSDCRNEPNPKSHQSHS